MLDVRRLIGVKGARIREVEEATRTRIKLEVEPEPTVTIVGSDQGREDARRRIAEELCNNLEEAFEVPEEKHGTLIGVGGRTVRCQAWLGGLLRCQAFGVEMCQVLGVEMCQAWGSLCVVRCQAWGSLCVACCGSAGS